MVLNDKRGYVKVKYEGKMVWEHRLIWFKEYGHWPEVIDHINGDKSDNRIENLRNVTKGANNHLRPVRTDSSTKVKCVTPNGSGYMARVTKDKKTFYLGTFRTTEEAQKVVEDFSKELYPEHSEESVSLKALEKAYA